MEETTCIAMKKLSSSSSDHNHNHLIDLPPGFRFHPTDEEIITYYLTEKVLNTNFIASAIADADLNKCEPWDLPKRAKMGEKEWYFFCQRDRKYPTGMRTNRATESGYWKATGKDKEIYNKGNIKNSLLSSSSSSSSSSSTNLVGMKKTLVFYKGRAPKGEKSNWVMHEYRLEGKFSYYNLPKSAKDEWVVCRVFHKNIGNNNNNIQKKIMNPNNNMMMMINNNNSNHHINHGLLRINSLGVDDMLDCSNSLPPLTDDIPPPPYTTTTTTTNNNNYQNDTNFNQTTSNYYYTSFYSSNNPIIQNYDFNNNCKVEQFSNHDSMVSVSQDDTGLSTDNINNTTEISSVVSDHHQRQQQQQQHTVSFHHDGLISGFDGQDVFWDDL
ncbi:hypothetical protein CsatA_026937 [Cannabis sativa]